ncbi:unnamed protein product, partial [marine sediment metagenome]
TGKGGQEYNPSSLILESHETDFSQEGAKHR